jgi:hypothetical protein
MVPSWLACIMDTWSAPRFSLKKKGAKRAIASCGARTKQKPELPFFNYVKLLKGISSMAQ